MRRTCVCVQINCIFHFHNTLFNLQCELDAKTEEIFQLEPKMDKMRARVVELESELAAIHRQIK